MRNVWSESPSPGLDFKVSLEDKTVTIDGCENCVAKAKELMDDLGFDTVEV